MPYLIRTINPKGATEQDSDGRSFYVPVSSRRAVATLEEARQHCFAVPPDESYYGEFDDFYEAVAALPESGGTVGPLPDGTVIEVGRCSWMYLKIHTDLPGDPHGTLSEREIIDAYNARQSDAR